MIGTEGFFCFQLFANIEPAHARHHHVEHDEIRTVVERAVETTDAIVSADHFVTFVLEVVAQSGHHRRFVFND